MTNSKNISSGPLPYYDIYRKVKEKIAFLLLFLQLRALQEMLSLMPVVVLDDGVENSQGVYI